MRSSNASLVMLTLLLATLACSVPGSTPTPDRGVVQTAVEATLSASEGGEPGPATPEGSPEPVGGPSPAPPSPAPPPIPRLVYTDAGNVWLIEGANPPVQLTSSGDANRTLISDDGMKVVYVRSVTAESLSELHSINSDGSGDLTLMTPADFDALYPLGPMLHNDLADLAFVPGTHTLLFNTRGVPEGPGLFKHNNVLALDSDTGVMTTVFAAETGGDFLISPDGTQLAIVQPDNISLANIDGTNLRPDVVTYSPVITYSEFMYYAQPVWAPDSSAVGVAIPSADPLNPPTTGTVWRIPADGSPAVNVGTISGSFYFPQVFGAPLLAPDLSRLAFLEETVTPNEFNLILANADGSAQTTFASGNIAWEGWGPDSSHFVYAFSGPMNLQLGVDGGAPLAIGSCTDLRWQTPTRYFCLSGSMGSWTLMRGELGVGLTPLVNPGGDFISYDFSP